MLYDDEETADEYIQFYDFSSAYESAADGDDEEWEDLEEAGGNCENDVEEMVKEEDEAEEDVHQSAGPSLANAGKYRRPAPAER